MKITNYQAGNYIDILTGLNESGKLGFAIARNLRKISDEAKEYLDLRAKLFQQYGKQINGGKAYTIDSKTNPEGYAAYIKEMGDIPSLVIDVDVFKVDEETFYSGNLTSTQMAQLMWMVDDGPEKVKGEVV